MKTKKSIWVLGHKISPLPSSGNFDMVIGETPAHVPGPPPHYHTNLSEVFMVLEGEMDFVVNGNPIRLGKGEMVDLPKNTVHTFKNSGDTPCKWLNIHSPKGFLSFFDTMGVPEDKDDAQTQSTQEDLIQKVMQEAVNFDMHIKF